MTQSAVVMRSAERLFRSAGGLVRAVNGIDLVVDGGECVAVMGPSGSGKSTLLSLLGALESPSGGSVEVLGVELSALSPEERARFRRSRIGFVFQDHDLLPFLSAVENVELAI